MSRSPAVAGGVFSGTVRDPDGKTLPNVGVMAYQITYREDGRRQLLVTCPTPCRSGALIKSTTTDDRGNYRLFHMPPGDYLIGRFRGKISVRPRHRVPRTLSSGLSIPV